MRLKAFTLLEVIIGMVLFSIITGLGSSAYLFVSKQFLDYKKTGVVIQNNVTMDALLSKDFSECYAVKSENNGITCFYIDIPPVQYKLTDRYILRTQQQRLDTFMTPALNIKMTFKDEPLQKDSLVDQLSFNTKMFDKDIQMNYSKLYGADLLMELEAREETGDTY